jgi:hypothetical protein
MSALVGKAHVPNYGEPWQLQEPDEEHPYFRLMDAGGTERMRTPGASPDDRRYAERVRDAIDGTVNFPDDALAELARKWNRNAGA